MLLFLLQGYGMAWRRQNINMFQLLFQLVLLQVSLQSDAYSFNWNSALICSYSKPSTFLLQSQEGNTPCFWPMSNQVPADSRTKRPVSSSSILSTVNSLTSGSNKSSSSSSSSRHVPVVSQLSLSRPQCSFVHIDGVQCGAVTWNKYVKMCFAIFEASRFKGA